jgi:hypothetical protein
MIGIGIPSSHNRIPLPMLTSCWCSADQQEQMTRSSLPLHERRNLDQASLPVVPDRNFLPSSALCGQQRLVAKQPVIRAQGGSSGGCSGYIKDTENPEMYRAYLDKYPEGEFSPLAQIKLTELEARSRA